MKRTLSIFCLVALAWAFVHAEPIDPKTAAGFFTHYYDLRMQAPKSHDADNEEKLFAVPAWFGKFCAERSLPIDCGSKDLQTTDLHALLKLFEESAYNSKNSGLILQALLAAKEQPHLSFQIMRELLERFPAEFNFHRISDYRKEKAEWDELLLSLPLQETEVIEAGGKQLLLRFRSDGHLFSITIENEDGELIFKDGPRWLLYKDHPDRKQLNTSMTTTWSDPDYRGAGLYQYALDYYLKRLDVNRTKLYTENEETLEFIYRMKGLIYEKSQREKLLAIDGVPQYLKALGVNIVGFQKGQLRHLRDAENLLAFLSLQGKTRLNLGFDFRLGELYPAVIQSDKLSDSRVAQIHTEIQSLKTKLVEQLLNPSTAAALEILPRSYLRKLQADAPCAALLTKKAS